MEDFITALGLVLVIEGLLYALFPEALKRMAVHIVQLPAQQMRYGGGVALALGVLIVWLVRGQG
jgi:uncharacterized protein